jgi:hypothetical protein
MNKFIGLAFAIVLILGVVVFGSLANAQAVTSTTTSTTTVTTNGTAPATTGAAGTASSNLCSNPPYGPYCEQNGSGAGTNATTPGFPTTGMGGELMLNLIVLFASAALICGGVVYLVRQVRVS